MRPTDEEILINMCNLMDSAGIPHNCNGDNYIEIDKHYSIEIDKTTSPWRCNLVHDGKKIYSSNPTGIVIVTRARLAQEKHYREKIRKINHVASKEK